MSAPAPVAGLVALYPGSFDPPHLGHLSLIRRAAALVARLIVGVGWNPAKNPSLPVELRLELLRQDCAGLANVSVVAYQGATLQAARAHGAQVLIRGVRSGSDLETESTMAAIHRRHGLETILLCADGAVAHVSSSAVRLCRSAGLPLDGLVSPAVAAALSAPPRP
jgi:pantetheine-phosphate adenylyltransferase